MNKPVLRAFILPFVVFMLFLGFSDWIAHPGSLNLFLSKPKYWIFPLQTLVCGALVIAYWRHYSLKFPKCLLFTLLIAVATLVIWVAPQVFFGWPKRYDGFDPTVLANQPGFYWATLVLRFLRLVIVVPFVEEIFWRGFLMRYLIKENFEEVPLGTFSWLSFGGVTLLCGLAHWGSSCWIPGQDFIPALAYGALFNWIAIRTRSLTSCILAHSVTNLLLGVYIMFTGQWGFW